MKSESTTFRLTSLLLSAGRFPLRLKNRLHFFALSLSADVSSQTLLGELETSFVLGDLQQLEAALLVRREAGDFTHHLANEFDVFVLHPLPSRRLHRRLWREGGAKGEESFTKIILTTKQLLPLAPCISFKTITLCLVTRKPLSLTRPMAIAYFGAIFYLPYLLKRILLKMLFLGEEAENKHWRN